jgi:C-terminal processing protease CtpA/Prc
MKKILFCLFILSSLHTFSIEKISEDQKYNQAGLVWGLMKYHHPEISNGKYDWDSIFIELCTKLEPIKNQSEMNDLLLNFVGSYKTNKLKEKNANAEEGLFLKNKDYSWIDTTVFGEELTSSLLKLKNNTNISNYYASTDMLARMLSFKNEKGFKNFDYNVRSHRLLLLYSFWNAMEYWNVNKYLTDEKWLSILDYLTSDFIACKTQFDFEMAKHKMISKLNDSHAAYGSVVVSNYLLKFIPLFRVKNINDSLVVNSIFNKENATKDNLVLGDIITKIDDKNISTCIKDKLSNLISSSNPSYLKQYSYTMLYNTIDSIKVEILKKDGTKINKYIHLHKELTTDQPSYLENIKKDKWFFIKPSIAYINLDKITSKELKGVFEQITNTEGLILDLRNYPRKISNSDLSKYLYPHKKEFIKVLFPIKNNPAYGEYDGDAPLKIIADPFKSGHNNPDYYKGKIILLVNNTTQSRSEFMGMAIQQSPNCFTIGEQTSGAVMNVVPYTMPDKTRVDFTGFGAFYPNGDGLQRKGLHIDYYVKESAKNYDPELYLKEAVKLIENK